MVTKKSLPSEQSTLEVRVIDFKLTGSDEALRESLQTISAAFGRQNVQVNRATAAPARAVQLASPPASPEADTEADEENDGAELVVENAPRAATTTRRPAKAPVVKVLDGINFTDTTPPLREFYEAKNPSNDLAKYCVVAYWYKNHRGISDLTPDHFHTAFRALKVSTPRNALQPIRDLRHNRNGKFTAGSTKGTATIHHIGETFVEEMGKDA